MLPLCREAPRNRAVSPFGMWGQWPKVINCANFQLSRSTSFCGLNTPEILIPIGIASGPYNSLGITMCCCDCRSILLANSIWDGKLLKRPHFRLRPFIPAVSVLSNRNILHCLRYFIVYAIIVMIIISGR